MDKRWRSSSLQTLIVVNKEITQVKTGKHIREKSYWVSVMMLNVGAIEKLSKAVRSYYWDRNAHYYVETSKWAKRRYARNKSESKFSALH